MKRFDIRDRNGNLHFTRWRLIELPWFGLYIHRILLPDGDLHQHNHPWSFWSLILWGSYLEQVGDRLNERQSGSITFRTAEKYHRVVRTNGAWTLILRGPRRPSWGYDVDGKHVESAEYRRTR